MAQRKQQLRTWLGVALLALVPLLIFAVYTWASRNSSTEHGSQPVVERRAEPPRPARRSVPAATPATAVTAAPPPSSAPPVTAAERALMAELRSVERSDFARAYELAHEGNRRFPSSPLAAERAAIAVRSLALQGKLSDARREAEDMVNRYPGTPWALEVERNTGAHPRRR